MQQSPSWEANLFSASQQIPHILCKPKVHYRIHKCQSPVPTLSQIDPPHPTSSRSILILSPHLLLGLPRGKTDIRTTCTSPVIMMLIRNCVTCSWFPVPLSSSRWCWNVSGSTTLYITRLHQVTPVPFTLNCSTQESQLLSFQNECTVNRL
jgi:hypothetical protein